MNNAAVPLRTADTEIAPYTSRWEDGLIQLDIPKKKMSDVVAEDNASAGAGSSLTADVITHLAWVGKTVGPVFDGVRKSVHLAALQKVRR